MTLTTLLIRIAIVAIILTLGVNYLAKARKNWLMSYLQNFAGALFVFSGWVKAVDPLGTAYKMKDYFAEFESTFSETWMSSLAPLFPFLAEYAIAFSVFMIVLEIVIGLMLIMGARPKFTAWIFFGIIAFFTFLTGFTYLTGFVPEDINFFDFGQWAAYDARNMKVTDCGCFGDFIKLEPKVSFFKDVFLLIPAIYFVWRSRDMHALFTKKIRTIISWSSVAILLLYCFSNYVWDIPHADFRPFRENVNIREQKTIEEDAMANVQIIGWIMENIKTGQVVEVPNPDYKAAVKDYPKPDWKVKDQLKTKPLIKSTKISEFAIEHPDGYENTEEVLNEKGYSLMIVCHELQTSGSISTTKIVYDTIFRLDSTIVNDSLVVERKVDNIKSREIKKEIVQFDKAYQAPFIETVNPFAEAAEQAGVKVFAVAGGAGMDMVDDFRHATQTAYPFYMADNILLKTIVRSNPGMVLMKDGLIIKKWHHRQLPDFDEVKKQYMSEKN